MKSSSGYLQKTADDHATVVLFNDRKELSWFAGRTGVLDKYSNGILEQKKKGVFTYFDKNKRPFLFFKVDTLDEFEALLLKLKKMQHMQSEKQFISL